MLSNLKGGGVMVEKSFKLFRRILFFAPIYLVLNILLKHISPVIPPYVLNSFFLISAALIALPVAFEAEDIAVTEWLDAPPHPWRRFFARALDTLAMGMLVFSAVGFLLGFTAPHLTHILFSPFNKYTGFILSTFVVTFPNALLISTTGSTLGKYFFGIRVIDDEGKILSYRKAWVRELRVWIQGMLLGIQFLNIVTLALSYKKLKRTNSTSWDAALKTSILYRGKSWEQLSNAALGGIILIIVYAHSVHHSMSEFINTYF